MSFLSRSLPHSAWFTSISLALLVFPAWCDAQTSAAARKIYQAHQDSLVVITARCVIEFTTDSGTLPNQEQKTQTLGTIIHPKGLIMISNSALDLSVGMKGQKGRAAGSEEFVTVTNARARFPEIQINLSDGSEYHASRVSQNPDLDVAFLLIDQKLIRERKEPLPFVDINYRITEGGLRIADEVVGLSRSSPVYLYIPSVIPGFVTAISKRPEATYYITTSGTSQGVPLFTLEGKFVGMTVQRIVGDQRTNLLGTLAAGSIKSLADLAKTKRGLK